MGFKPYLEDQLVSFSALTLLAAADPGGVRWVRTNPPSGRVVVENARTAWLYQSSSVRDIFTEIVPQLYTT